MMSSSSDSTGWSILRARCHPGNLVVSCALPLFLSLFTGSTYALGLGQLQGRSDLGAPFKASLPVFGEGADSVRSSCIKTKILALDGTQIAVARATINETAQGRSMVLSTATAVNEPVVTVSVDIQCEQPMHREYQVLLNPPGMTFREEGVVKAVRVFEPENISRVPAAEASKPAMPQVRVQAEPDRVQAAAQAARAQKAPVVQRPVKPVQSPPAPARNMLKLSSGNDTAQEIAEIESLALRLSTRLSPIGMEGAAANADALADAAASQNALPDTEERFQALMKKIDALDAETQQLNGLLQKNRLALQQTRMQEKTTQGWLVALAVFGVACLGMLAWLARRMHQLHQKDRMSGDQWYVLDPADTDARMDPVVEEPEVEKPSENMEVALHKAGPTQVHVDADSLEEEETAAEPGNLVDWPVASSGSSSLSSSSGKKAPADSFMDEYGGHFHRTPTGLETKEIQDVMQQAEFWISLENPSTAIEVLEFHVHNRPDRNKSTMPWMLLFELYRRHDFQQKYALLQESFSRTFDENPPSWEEEPAQEPESSQPLQAASLPILDSSKASAL